MIRHPFLQALATGAFLLSLSGCAEAPIKVTDNNVEKPLEQITGVTSNNVEKAMQKPQMNLWDVYALAVKHTEDLAGKYENILQANAQSQQAVGSVLPQIYLNGTKGWDSNNNNGVGGAIAGSIVPNDTVYLSGTETILTGLNQAAALQGAQAQIDQNHHLYKQEARTLLLNVARSFYGILQLQDTLQSKQEIEGLTLEILKQEQQWKNIGRSRDSDVLTTEAQLAQLKGDEEAAQGQLNIARDSLVVLTGLKTEQPLVSEEQPIPASMSFEEAETRVDGRSDVLAAKAGVDLAGAAVLQAHGEHLPNLSVQGKYFLDSDGASTSAWNVQLVASLPLFEGGEVVAQEDTADSKKRQADLQYSLTRRQALQDIRGAYRALANSLSEVDAYGKALDAAQKDYTAVERDRRLALNTNLDVLNALTQLETAKTNYDQAKYQVLINSIWLGEATGDLPKTVNK